MTDDTYRFEIVQIGKMDEVPIVTRTCAMASVQC